MRSRYSPGCGGACQVVVCVLLLFGASVALWCVHRARLRAAQENRFARAVLQAIDGERFFPEPNAVSMPSSNELHDFIASVHKEVVDDGKGGLLRPPDKYTLVVTVSGDVGRLSLWKKGAVMTPGGVPLARREVGIHDNEGRANPQVGHGDGP